jgi:hypothetical protein
MYSATGIRLLQELQGKVRIIDDANLFALVLGNHLPNLDRTWSVANNFSKTTIAYFASPIISANASCAKDPLLAGFQTLKFSRYNVHFSVRVSFGLLCLVSPEAVTIAVLEDALLTLLQEYSFRDFSTQEIVFFLIDAPNEGWCRLVVLTPRKF